MNKKEDVAKNATTEKHAESCRAYYCEGECLRGEKPKSPSLVRSSDQCPPY